MVFTDGEDTASRCNLQDVIDHANSNNVALHTIGFSSGFDIEVLARRAVETGGGPFIYSTDTKRLISYYGALGSFLSGSSQFYRTVWNDQLTWNLGPYSFGPGGWFQTWLDMQTPSGRLSVPFRIDF